MNRTDIILSCFLRLISIFSISPDAHCISHVQFIQSPVGLREFEATVSARVSMSIESCPLTPSLPEGFEEAKGPGVGVGSEDFVWATIKCIGFSHKALWYWYDPALFSLNFYLSPLCTQLAKTDPTPFPPENHVIPAKSSVPPAPWW